jgi:hypothetical protein
MLSTARIPATAGTPALSKGHQQEKAQPQPQKCQQQQDLCGKATKVAGNMAVNVAVIKNNLMAVKGPQVAVVFARGGSESLQGSGNTAKKCPEAAGWAGWLVGAAAAALAAGAADACNV